MEGRDLNLAFGGKKLYFDANFRLEKGDKVGVVGVNGSGKSTLFKIILGIDKLDSGKITYPDVLRIGYLPQEIAINDDAGDMTVWDFVNNARPFEQLQNEISKEYEKYMKLTVSLMVAAQIVFAFHSYLGREDRNPWRWFSKEYYEQWDEDILKTYNSKGIFSELILHFILRDLKAT